MLRGRGGQEVVEGGRRRERLASINTAISRANRGKTTAIRARFSGRNIHFPVMVCVKIADTASTVATPRTTSHSPKAFHEYIGKMAMWEIGQVIIIRGSRKWAELISTSSLSHSPSLWIALCHHGAYRWNVESLSGGKRSLGYYAHSGRQIRSSTPKWRERDEEEEEITMRAYSRISVDVLGWWPHMGWRSWDSPTSAPQMKLGIIYFLFNRTFL